VSAGRLAGTLEAGNGDGDFDLNLGDRRGFVLLADVERDRETGLETSGICDPDGFP
jgi:hypothetical protein